MAPAASYFTDDSPARRVHRETMVAFAGPRALLLMAAHPIAFEGFFEATGARDKPYERLRRTAVVLDAVLWGTKSQADRRTRRVRAMHSRASGTLPHDAGPFPAGTPYAADDPDLLLWILAALVDSSVLVYDRYVERMDYAARDAYWQDFRVIGRLFGLRDRDMPRSWAGFETYMEGMLASGELVVTPTAREVGVQIVLRPPVSVRNRPLLELVNFITVGLLPGDLRRQYGLRWDPARSLALRGGAEYTRRVLLPLLPERVRHVPSARSRAA